MIALKKKKWLIIISILIVLTVVGIANLRPSYSSVLEANWDISLPWKARISEIYQKDSGASFLGDGVRYHVFSYKHEDYINRMFSWSPVEFDTNFFYPTISDATEEWLDEIDVPADKRPDYTNCFSWYKSDQRDNSEVVFFWDAELKYLYVIEYFV